MRLIFVFIILSALMSGFVKKTKAGTEPESGTKRYTISGNIRDKSTGEELLGATVYVKEQQTGTTTNYYGFYSLSLEPGTYRLTYSYMGYESVQETIQLAENITINVELESRHETLKETVITAEKKNENVTKTEMSVVKMDVKTINKIPALMGSRHRLPGWVRKFWFL